MANPSLRSAPLGRFITTMDTITTTLTSQIETTERTLREEEARIAELTTKRDSLMAQAQKLRDQEAVAAQKARVEKVTQIMAFLGVATMQEAVNLIYAQFPEVAPSSAAVKVSLKNRAKGRVFLTKEQNDTMIAGFKAGKSAAWAHKEFGLGMSTTFVKRRNALKGLKGKAKIASRHILTDAEKANIIKMVTKQKKPVAKVAPQFQVTAQAVYRMLQREGVKMAA